jgi:hypothetical protein
MVPAPLQPVDLVKRSLEELLCRGIDYSGE